MRSLPPIPNEAPRVKADVDFDKAGKQYGHIRVPRPQPHEVLGVCGIPIVVIKNGSGPTFLLTAGTHGDEFGGQVGLLNLARTLEPEQVQGRIIIIPALDLPAVEVNNRLCPVDGRDLNRTFPGNRNGSFTEMLADYVTRVLLPMTDYNMDIHAGGNFHTTAPNTCQHFVDDPKQMKANIDIGMAWGAPYHAVLRESDHTNSFMTIADRMGIPALSAEFGGLGQIGTDTLPIIERGLRNMLKLHGAIEGKIDAPATPPRLMGLTDPSTAIVSAPHSGLFQAFHAGGDWVEKDQRAGLIYDFRDPSRPPTEVHYKQSGCLWAVHSGARVERFDGLAIIINDLDPAELGLPA
jgi:predicted deacylase